MEIKIKILIVLIALFMGERESAGKTKCWVFYDTNWKTSCVNLNKERLFRELFRNEF